MKIKTRYYAEGEWEAESAVHFGGEDDGDGVDMVLLRSADGTHFIPAASIAGAVRSYLRRVKVPDPAALDMLFGAGPGQKQYASLLTVFDAPRLGGLRPAVRDGVAINAKTGQAIDGAKYNLEVLPKGSKFRLRFLLPVYDEKLPESDADQVLKVFRWALEAFESEGAIRLGARTRRGLGRGKVGKWRIAARSFADDDLHRAQAAVVADVVAWLRQDWTTGEWKLGLNDVSPSPLKPPEAFLISAKLRLKTSLLVRGPSGKFDDPDMAQLREEQDGGYRIVLPGSAIAGALRSRAERIANTLKLGEDVVAGMFGPPRKAKTLRAGRLRVEEAYTMARRLWAQGRVKIDRFTGGAFGGALFDEAPFYPENDQSATMTFRFELEAPKDKEIALLLLTFKDLWLGDLPLGGETGVGRGVFEGVEASFRSNGKEITVTAPPGNPAGIDCKQADLLTDLEKKVKALQEAK